MKPDQYFKAHLAAHDVSMSLHACHERHNWCVEDMDKYSFVRAKEGLKELAAMFGFDLVQREPVKLEAAE